METWCEGVYFEPGPNKPNLAGIILSCGIHGDETGPIHLLQRLHNELQSAALAPSRPLLLIFGNPDAIRHQQRYVDSNLNRLFTRTPSPQPVAGESREAARARQLMQVCQRFQQQVPQVDLHLDLHSTIKRSCIERFALTPVHSGHYSDRWLGQLWQAGFGGLVHQTRRANTFSQFSLDVLGADSFTLECGSLQQSDEPHDQRLWDWLVNLVGSEVAWHTKEPGGRQQPALRQFTVAEEIIRASDQFRFLVDEGLPNFSQHPPGTAIYQEARGTFTIDEERFSLFLNSRVETGQRAGLLLKHLQ